ncbi:hypothetical protein OF83DRAFT_1097983 [Amylostereum chailletii]|nr:hypothetical protein OF83DRAFT_1097983 [Amylostereum chailletii]
MSKESVLGTLVVVVLKAQHLIDNHTFYKQDPYCTISLGNTTKKTEIDPKGGQHPVWDAEFRFTISKDAAKANRTITLKCHSQEKKDDQLLGEGSVDISDTLKSGEFDDWVPLSLNGAQRGDVYLEMTFFAAGPAPVVRRASKLQPKDRLAPPNQPYVQGTSHLSPRPPNASLPVSAPRQSLEPSPRLRPTQPQQQLFPGRPSQIPLPNSRSHSRSPKDRDSALPPLPSGANSRPPAPAVPTSLRAGAHPQQIAGRPRLPSEATPPSRYPGMASSPPTTARPTTLHNSVGYPSHETVNGMPAHQGVAAQQARPESYYPPEPYLGQARRSSPPRTYGQSAPQPSEPYSSPYPVQPPRSSPPRTHVPLAQPPPDPYSSPYPAQPRRSSPPRTYAQPVPPTGPHEHPPTAPRLLHRHSLFLSPLQGAIQAAMGMALRPHSPRPPQSPANRSCRIPTSNDGTKLHSRSRAPLPILVSLCCNLLRVQLLLHTHHLCRSQRVAPRRFLVDPRQTKSRRGRCNDAKRRPSGDARSRKTWMRSSRATWTWS